jgi:hypothetical protein
MKALGSVLEPSFNIGRIHIREDYRYRTGKSDFGR